MVVVLEQLQETSADGKGLRLTFEETILLSLLHFSLKNRCYPHTQR